MKIYQTTHNQISSEVGGESIILNHKEGLYFNLNEVGTLVWNRLLQSPASFGDLKELILSQYEIDEKTCEEDLKTLLSELIHEDLVKEN